MTNLAVFVTNFADGGVVGPLCAAVAATLLLLRCTRTALVWTAVTLAVWGIMLMLKLAGYTMGYLVPVVQEQFGLLTASGHVAAAAACYGALCGLLAGSAATAVRRSCGAAIAIALLIGTTRVVLNEHTLAEVVLGGVVGVLGAAAFAASTREALHGRRRAAVLAATAATLIVLHGEHRTLEPEIAAASARAAQTLRAW